MIINQLRKYDEYYTTGRIFVNGLYYCKSLEDQLRPYGEKVMGQTCIPEVVCKVSISRSTRFRKNMMLLSNRDDYSVEGNGIRFTGIRPHSGRNIGHTGGCPLLGFESKGDQLFNAASKPLFEMVKAAILRSEEVIWVISADM